MSRRHAGQRHQRLWSVQLVLTTNYDTLVETVSQYKTVKWNEGRNAMAAVRSRDNVVLHLHGVWSDPDSVVLGWSDYQHLTDTPLQTFAKDVMTTTETLLFVGCGAGLDDPSVGPALRFAADVMPD